MINDYMWLYLYICIWLYQYHIIYLYIAICIHIPDPGENVFQQLLAQVDGHVHQGLTDFLQGRYQLQTPWTGRESFESFESSIPPELMVESTVRRNFLPGPAGNWLQFAMENHHCEWENSRFQWPFSIAMLNYQIVLLSVPLILKTTPSVSFWGGWLQ